MIEIVCCTRDALIRDFGCSRRLATRLGALMNRRITVSAMVMEEARPGTSLEALLLQKSLLDDEDIAHALEESAASEQFARLADDFPLVIVQQDGWQVIAAEEEKLAEKGFSEIAANTAEPHAPVPTASPPQPYAAEPVMRDNTAISFSADEIARLRVNIFAGITSADKVAALRQLAYARMPQHDKILIFLQAIADEDSNLRAAAAKALPLLGAPGDIADAIRMLSEGKPEERKAGAARLRDLAVSTSDIGRDAITMALLGTLRSPDTPTDIFFAVLQVMRDSCASLGAGRLCREDILRMLMDRMLGCNQEALAAIRCCIIAIEDLRPGYAAGFLLNEISRMRAGVHQARILHVLTGMNLPEESKEKVMLAASDNLLVLSSDTDACRSLSNYLVACRDKGLCLIAGQMTEADIPHQRYFIRVLDNTLRSQKVSPQTRETIAEAGLELLRKSPGQVRSDILETIVASHQDLPPALRTRLAEAFLRDLHTYGRRPLADIMQAALVRLGEPAIPPLVTVLTERRNSPDAAVAARALGLIGMRLTTPEPDTGDNKAEDILRHLQKLSFTRTAVIDHLHLAMGRICTNLAVSPEVVDLVLRTMLSRIKGVAEDAAIIEAMGLACNGREVNPGYIRTVAGLALGHLQSTPPDPTFEVGTIQGEEVFEVSGPVDVYSKLIPACIAALVEIVLGKNTPDELRREIISSLLDNWTRAISFDLQWGPANVAQLTSALGKIGSCDHIDPDLRTRIANTLARHAGDLPVLSALADILSRGDHNTQLDRLAGSLVLRMLGLLEGSDNLSTEDQELYLRMLAKLGLRGRFAIRGGNEDRLIDRMLGTLVNGLGKGIPGCYQHLAALRNAGRLPRQHLDRIDQELRRFSSLVRISAESQ